MTSKEALEKIKNNSTEAGYEIAKSSGLKDTELVKTVVAKGKTYVIYPEEELNIIEKDLEVLDLLKRNIKYNTLLATNCDKQGKVSGKYRELTIIINEKDLDKVEDWLENDK